MKIQINVFFDSYSAKVLHGGIEEMVISIIIVPSQTGVLI